MFTEAVCLRRAPANVFAIQVSGYDGLTSKLLAFVKYLLIHIRPRWIIVVDVVLVPSSAPGGRTWAFLGPHMFQIGLGVP